MNFDNIKLYAHDKDYRKKIIDNPRSVFQDIDKDVEIKVIKNSKNIFYIATDSQSAIDGYQLGNINAAGTNGTVGSVSTAATLGTVCATASTVGTGGSAGTISSK